jgi:hypothetical protein
MHVEPPPHCGDAGSALAPRGGRRGRRTRRGHGARRGDARSGIGGDDHRGHDDDHGDNDDGPHHNGDNDHCTGDNHQLDDDVGNGHHHVARIGRRPADEAIPTVAHKSQ